MQEKIEKETKTKTNTWENMSWELTRPVKEGSYYFAWWVSPTQVRRGPTEYKVFASKQPALN